MPRDTYSFPGELVITSQWDGTFMAEAARWRENFRRRAGFPVACLDGASHTREDVFAHLRNGGSLVYLGHGHTRGWMGFRGIRAGHLHNLKGPPLGCVLAFTCYATCGPESLGTAWLANGRAHCVLGPSGSVQTESLLTVSSMMRRALGAHPDLSVGALLQQTRYTARDPSVRACLEGFRLIGDPGQPALPGRC